MYTGSVKVREWELLSGAKFFVLPPFFAIYLDTLFLGKTRWSHNNLREHLYGMVECARSIVDMAETFRTSLGLT